MQKKDRILITGFSGFVAKHFLGFLYNNNINWEVLGVDINSPKFKLDQFTDRIPVRYKELNLLNVDEVVACCKEFRPGYILHLASFSSVAYSWKNPNECFVNNTNIFLNLVNAVRINEINCRILSVGSSEEYGNVTEEELPLREDAILKPISPYAVARVSQEMLGKVFVDSYHMDIIMTRSFNHIGPWQDSRFVIPSFIEKISDVYKRGDKAGEIETGDTSIIRDFIDVRDVVKAYYLLLIKGKSGEIYNICSEKGISLDEIIKLISKEIGVETTCKVNPEFVRPMDNHIIVGSAEKIRRELNWKAEILITQTLKDMIAEYL